MSAAHGTALTGGDYADLWAHAGMVAYQGEKMSKSLGNLVKVSELVAAGRDPRAVRLALGTHHYRADREWFDADLVEAEARLARWVAWAATAGGAERATTPTALLVARAGRAGRRPRRPGRAHRGRRRRGVGRTGRPRSTSTRSRPCSGSTSAPEAGPGRRGRTPIGVSVEVRRGPGGTVGPPRR